MELLCVGDVALLSVDGNAPRQVWETPAGIVPGDEEKILFNLEFPIGDAINSQPRSSGPRFLAHPDSLYVLQKWAPGFAALANNHILDAGKDGLVKTIQTLKQTGFTILGAGQTREEIVRPVLWETSEGRLAMVNWVFPETHPDWGCVPGPNCWPGLEEAERIIQNLKHRADWVLIRGHWSDEDFAYPRPEDRATARELARMGADLVIGDHPHVVRGMEVIRSCLVFYSIGNFYFSYEPNPPGSWNMRAPRNREGLGIQISFRRGRRPEYRPVSFWKGKSRVVRDPTRRAATRLVRVSQPLRRFQDSEYAEWYMKKRAVFDKWGWRWHFRLWNLTMNDVKRILLKPFRCFQQSNDVA
jgi:poly-gamma-glutamate synthesis protein (capsule biosynthesis protein)